MKNQVIVDYHERSQSVNRFMVAAIAQTDPVVAMWACAKLVGVIEVLMLGRAFVGS